MYAIAVELRTDSSEKLREVDELLLSRGFDRLFGVYFGGPEINAVTCVLAAMELSRTLPWFAGSVRDIRMLRIEELNDLMPAIRQAAE